MNGSDSKTADQDYKESQRKEDKVDVREIFSI